MDAILNRTAKIIAIIERSLRPPLSYLRLLKFLIIAMNAA